MTRDSIREGLVELALRVEAATGPDRELDALIRCAVFAPEGACVEKSPHNGAWCIYDGKDRQGRSRLWEPRTLTRLQRLGEFTASLDAAMSLVPEGWAICTGHGVEGEQGSYFTILTYLDPETESETVREATGDNWAATVCAAALRAKAQS